jgi:hypothetical protein
MRLVAASLLVLAVVGGGFSSADDDPPDAAASGGTPSSAPTSSASSADPGATLEVEPTDLPEVEDVETAGGTRLDVGDADWIQVVKGVAWTAVPGAVVRLDERGHETARVPAAPGSCLAMDVGYGSLWVGVCHPRSPEVLRIDLRTGKLAAAIPLPPGLQLVPEGSVGAGEGSVWVVVSSGAGDKELLEIDPGADRVVGRHRMPLTVAGVRAGLGGVWVTDPSNGRLLHVDPADGRVVARIPTGLGARFLDVGEGAVWVQNNTDGTVSRVDADTDEAIATIPVDQGVVNGGDLAVGGGSVWARVTSSLVTEIDPATNTAVARYGMPEGSGSVAADDGSVWITAHDVDAAYRIPLN